MIINCRHCNKTDVEFFKKYNRLNFGLEVVGRCRDCNLVFHVPRNSVPPFLIEKLPFFKKKKKVIVNKQENQLDFTLYF